MSFSQALSGLNAAKQNIDVIGNNIANSQTTGFKSSTIQFADVYAGSQVGQGVRVAGVMQDFGNGTLQTTGRAMDLGINGSGFFRFQQGNQIVYSRNGQLTMTKDGFLENASGAKLTGYVGGVTVGGQPEPIQVPSGAMEATATTSVGESLNLDATSTALPLSAVEYQHVASIQNVNLDNAATVIDRGTVPFDAANPATYTSLQTANFTDSLGNPHTVDTYYTKIDGTPNPDKWEVQVQVDGNSAGPASDLVFDGAGNVDTTASTINTYTNALGGDTDNMSLTLNPANIKEITGASTFPALTFATQGGFNASDASTYSYANTGTVYDSLGAQHIITTYYVKRPDQPNTWDVHVAIDGNHDTANDGKLVFDNNGVLNAAASTIPDVNYNAGNGSAPMNFTVGFTGTTQFGNKFALSSLTQDGYTSGSLVGISFDKAGNVVGNYSNEQTRTLGTIVLANFRDEEGLQPVGDNAWAETGTSGQPTLGVAGSGNLGQLEGGALEASNVDLATELVNLIIAQRTYQANTQTVKTQSQILEATVNMS